MSSFKINTDRLLEVGLQNEKVMAIAGSMVAYTGSMKFEKSILGGEGFFGALKRKVTNEGMSLMQTTGTGTVYFAQNAAEIAVIPLASEKLFIESSSLLAYDIALKTKILVKYKIQHAGAVFVGIGPYMRAIAQIAIWLALGKRRIGE